MAVNQTKTNIEQTIKIYLNHPRGDLKTLKMKRVQRNRWAELIQVKTIQNTWKRAKVIILDRNFNIGESPRAISGNLLEKITWNAMGGARLSATLLGGEKGANNPSDISISTQVHWEKVKKRMRTREDNAYGKRLSNK